MSLVRGAAERAKMTKIRVETETKAPAAARTQCEHFHTKRRNKKISWLLLTTDNGIENLCVVRVHFLQVDSFIFSFNTHFSCESSR